MKPTNAGPKSQSGPITNRQMTVANIPATMDAETAYTRVSLYQNRPIRKGRTIVGAQKS